MVAVCLAPTDLRPEVDELTGAVTADPRRADLSASERAALEYGLRIAEAWDGWVLAVAAAPPEAATVLREVSALGAEVVRVDVGPEGLGVTGGSTGLGRGAAGSVGVGPSAAGSVGPRLRSGVELAGHPDRTAAVLAEVIGHRGRPAIVLCGDRSGDAGTGAVPAFLAEELGVDQALGLVSVTIPAGQPGRLTVERRLDAGWRERLEVTGPAVLSVEAAGIRLRRAGLSAALEAPDPAVVRAGAPASAAERGRPGVAGAVGAVGAVGTVGPVGPVGLHVGAPRPYRPRTHPVPAPEGEAHDRLIALTGALSNREPPRVVGPADPAQAVDELLAYLERYGYGPVR